MSKNSDRRQNREPERRDATFVTETGVASVKPPEPEPDTPETVEAKLQIVDRARAAHREVFGE